MEFTQNVRERVAQKSGEEGTTTTGIERVTSTLPSMTWLIAAGASIAGSIALKAMGRDSSANFVGQWAPTFLILGLYNKIVKTMGSDRKSTAEPLH